MPDEPITPPAAPVEPPVTPPVDPAKTPDKDTVSREYAERLRRERDEAQAKTRKLEEAEAERARQALVDEKKFREAYEGERKRAEEIEAGWRERHKQSEQRYLRSELKAHAAALGMRDIDDIALADTSAVSLDDNGDVIGAREAIAALKERKPYLFAEPSAPKSPKTPSGQVPPPPKSDTPARDAFAMSDEEFEKAFADKYPRI